MAVQQGRTFVSCLLQANDASRAYAMQGRRWQAFSASCLGLLCDGAGPLSKGP